MTEIICNCEECQVLRELGNVTESLLTANLSEGPLVYFKYPYLEDESKEIAHQKGLKAGYMFRYNELQGYKLFEEV